jgi:predicted N-acetyltransferase YhbS
MVTIRAEISSYIGAREALLNAGFGPSRFRKTSEKLRNGRVPAFAYSAVNGEGKLIGTVRLWNIIAGSAGPSLLLGPLAVDTGAQGQGVGAALMATAIAAATAAGHDSILLVGDQPYYARFGFSQGLTRNLHLPGPVDRARFLGLELAEQALDGAEGLIAASGAMVEALQVAA